MVKRIILINYLVDSMRAKKQNFDTLLLSAIDETLFSLGESVEQSIYFHIQAKFNVQRTDIPNKLEEFQRALEKIFGAGARYIEILIMKNLYAKIGQPVNLENIKELEFIRYANAARETFKKNNL